MGLLFIFEDDWFVCYVNINVFIEIDNGIFLVMNGWIRIIRLSFL